MADQITSAKLCTVCGIDCAGKPRIKDQQGRYICKECFDKAKQTRQTQQNPPVPAAAAVAPSAVAAAPAEGDNSFLLDMGSKESTGLSGTKACPECGRALPSSAVICIGCGYNLSTGKRLAVKVVKTKQKAEKSSGGGGRTTNIPPVAFGLGVLVVGGGLIAAAQTSKEMALPALGMLLLLSLGVTIWGAVNAFQEGVGTGLLFLFIPFYALYWILSRCENEGLKWAWCAMALCNIVMNVLSSGLASP